MLGCLVAGSQSDVLARIGRDVEKMIALRDDRTSASLDDGATAPATATGMQAPRHGLDLAASSSHVGATDSVAIDVISSSSSSSSSSSTEVFAFDVVGASSAVSGSSSAVPFRFSTKRVHASN